MDYKKLYIQQLSYDGTTYQKVGTKIDTLDAFNIACQEFPFKRLPDIKDFPKRDWHDEDGEEVFIPSGGAKFKAYDLDVKFLYVGSQEDMQDDLNGFIDFLYGRNNSGSPILAVYDEYTQTGRLGIFVKSVGNELFAYDDINTDVIATFKVVFRVTDPVTEINENMNIPS